MESLKNLRALDERRVALDRRIDAANEKWRQAQQLTRDDTRLSIEAAELDKQIDGAVSDLIEGHGDKAAVEKLKSRHDDVLAQLAHAQEMGALISRGTERLRDELTHLQQESQALWEERAVAQRRYVREAADGAAQRFLDLARQCAEAWAALAVHAETLNQAEQTGWSTEMPKGGRFAFGGAMGIMPLAFPGFADLPAFNGCDGVAFLHAAGKAPQQRGQVALDYTAVRRQVAETWAADGVRF